MNEVLKIFSADEVYNYLDGDENRASQIFAGHDISYEMSLIHNFFTRINDRNIFAYFDGILFNVVIEGKNGYSKKLIKRKNVNMKHKEGYDILSLFYLLFLKHGNNPNSKFYKIYQKINNELTRIAFSTLYEAQAMSHTFDEKFLLDENALNLITNSDYNKEKYNDEKVYIWHIITKLDYKVPGKFVYSRDHTIMELVDIFSCGLLRELMKDSRIYITGGFLASILSFKYSKLKEFHKFSDIDVVFKAETKDFKSILENILQTYFSEYVCDYKSGRRCNVKIKCPNNFFVDDQNITFDFFCTVDHPIQRIKEFHFDPARTFIHQGKLHFFPSVIYCLLNDKKINLYGFLVNNLNSLEKFIIYLLKDYNFAFSHKEMRMLKLYLA